MDSNLLKRTADLRALADIRLVTVEDGPGRGQRLLIGRNASGLAFEVAVDRGFDVSGFSFKGTSIGWHSPVQMSYPARDPGSEDGWGFLRNLDGFLVTCGLDHYSRPHDTDVSHFNHPHIKTRAMPLHGRISAEKARLCGYGVDIGTGNICCEGIVRQASVFGETLELRRKIVVPVFTSELRIEDTVTNRGFRPSSHAMNYHLNFGFPFLDESLKIGSLPEPSGTHINLSPPWPEDDYGEKVDVVDSRITPHAPSISLMNENCGLTVQLGYSQATLPKLAIWRAYQSGIFALGIEPRTGLRSPEMKLLQPAETRSYTLEIGVRSLDGV